MIRDRLAAAGFKLPQPLAPSFLYVAVRVHRGVAYVSGQLPRVSSTALLHVGRVPDEVSVEQAQDCARLAALHALASLEAVAGPDALERVETVVKVTGFVHASSSFADAPTVIDAASEILQIAFAERGAHARSAVNVAGLPRRSPVEIECIVAGRF